MAARWSFWPRLLRRAVLRGAMRYLFGKRGQRRVKGLRLFYRLRTRVILGTSGPIGMLTRGSDVRLWVDGEESFKRLEKLLGRARHTIIIQMFIWKDDDTGRRIAQLLLSAADRGVQVEITKEAVGDFFEPVNDFVSTRHADVPLWKSFWHHPRIRVTHATYEDHAKVYVIDDHILLLTGMNIADEYRCKWHDYMVELRGSRFVEQFLMRKTVGDEKSVKLVMNTEEEKGIRPAVMHLLTSAKESVIVEHCYLSDPDVLSQLVRASQKGIRVTIILPSKIDLHHHANMSAVGRLLAEGKSGSLRVFLFPRMTHGKIILVDHATAFIGSANLMRSSLDEMGEVNVLIRSRYRVLWTLTETLRKDILMSRPLTSSPSLLWISRWLSWLGL